MAFYKYDQNNSGGSFDVDENITHRVVIEAVSESEADIIAKNIGIYFNGVDDGLDCDCCGDRWYGCNELKFPLHYGVNKVFDNMEDYLQYLATTYGACSPDIIVHYENGNKVRYYK